MTNYDPKDARMYILYYRRPLRGTPAQYGTQEADGYTYVYDIAKFYEIVFDTDVPGEPQHYLEPWPENEGTLFNSVGGRDIPAPYPIAGFKEILGFFGDGSTHWAS